MHAHCHDNRSYRVHYLTFYPAAAPQSCLVNLWRWVTVVVVHLTHHYYHVRVPRRLIMNGIIITIRIDGYKNSSPFRSSLLSSQPHESPVPKLRRSTNSVRFSHQRRRPLIIHSSIIHPCLDIKYSTIVPVSMILKPSQLFTLLLEPEAFTPHSHSDNTSCPRVLHRIPLLLSF